MREGYFKVWRKIFDNPLWGKGPKSRFEAFIFLLGHARDIDTIEDEVLIPKGAFVVDLKYLSEKLCWAEIDVSYFIDELRAAQIFSLEKVQGKVICKIRNYLKYQETKERMKAYNGYIPEEYRNWKKDYEVYSKYCLWGFKEFVKNTQSMQAIEMLYSRVDIRETLNKAFWGYWCTEGAWRKKVLRTTGLSIDWDTTIRGIFKMPDNLVYRRVVP